ncbi:hypothetical protein [Micromonospora sp. NBC_00617]|uniref:hypothetical protein n=1 Tax=Micromonospora sp. NBC_00617 TaxID=2903587 RepID=UPI0030E21BD6
MSEGVDRAMRVLELLAREPAQLGGVAADLADLRRLLPRLLATTQQISRDLGWSGP